MEPATTPTPRWEICGEACESVFGNSWCLVCLDAVAGIKVLDNVWFIAPASVKGLAPASVKGPAPASVKGLFALDGSSPQIAPNPDSSQHPVFSLIWLGYAHEQSAPSLVNTGDMVSAVNKQPDVVCDNGFQNCSRYRLCESGTRSWTQSIPGCNEESFAIVPTTPCSQQLVIIVGF